MIHENQNPSWCSQALQKNRQWKIQTQARLSAPRHAQEIAGCQAGVKKENTGLGIRYTGNQPDATQLMSEQNL